MNARASTKETALRAFWRGDIWVKLSALVWGAGCFARGQIAKGMLLAQKSQKKHDDEKSA